MAGFLLVTGAGGAEVVPVQAVYCRTDAAWVIGLLVCECAEDPTLCLI